MSRGRPERLPRRLSGGAGLRRRRGARIFQRWFACH